MSEMRLDRSNLPAIPATYSVSHITAEPEARETTIPLTHYVWVLRRHKWKILGFVLACCIATLLVSKRLTPIYAATATVDVDRQMPTALLGQDSGRVSVNDADEYLATQINLIKADSVVRPVVQKLRLRDVDGKDLIDVPGEVHSAAVEDAPVHLKRLEVIRPPNTYLLQITYESANPRLAAEVANAVANSYLQHSFEIRFKSSESVSKFMTAELEELKAKMERSSDALAKFQRDLSVVNPEEKTSILSARLQQLNTEYTNAQADRVRKEAGFNAMQSGQMEAALISSQGQSLKKLTDAYDEAQSRLADVKLHYGANHPEFKKAQGQVAELERQLQAAKASITEQVAIEYRTAAQREFMLKQELGRTKAESDALNAKSYGYEELKREAEADNKLYNELIRKIKEASINANFQTSNVRIADYARPPLRPVFPRTRLNVLIAFFFSTILAIGAAVMSDVLDNTLKDPEQIARTLHTQVIGTLPAMKSWRARLNPINKSDKAELVPLGELGDRYASGYDEAVRTLRNSILLTDFDRRLRSVLLTSASPSEGKSTVAAHLAVAHAEQKHRTLLIDGDLRRPSLHKFFEIPVNAGLSSVVLSNANWREVVIPIESVAGLDILPAGAPSRRAADMVGNRLPQIIEEAGLEYDLIVLDAPPLLGFPEPLQMAVNVDGVIVVSVAGQTSRKAVASVLSTLRRLRANVVGLVLNEVRKEMSDSYHYYGNYGKYYRSENEKRAS
jgi:polysaccharide biosynthesis transport protein